MTTEVERRPQILLDLDSKTPYGFNSDTVYVKKLEYEEFTAYEQALYSDTPLNGERMKKLFDITSFQMGNKLTLIKKIVKVSKVTVYFDKKEKEVLLFEVMTYKEVNKESYRYFAIKKFGIDENRWVEYMFKENKALDKKNIKDILKECEKKDFLNNFKISGDYLRIVQVYSLRSLPKNGYIKKIKDPVYIGEFLFNESGYQTGSQSFKAGDRIPFTLPNNGTTDMGKIEEQQEEKKDFLQTNTGMTTVVASGSVGGAAIGGTLIYLINNFR